MDIRTHPWRDVRSHKTPPRSPLRDGTNSKGRRRGEAAWPRVVSCFAWLTRLSSRLEAPKKLRWGFEIWRDCSEGGGEAGGAAAGGGEPKPEEEVVVAATDETAAAAAALVAGGGDSSKETPRSVVTAISDLGHGQIG